MKIESSQISYATAHRSATSTLKIDDTLGTARATDSRAKSLSMDQLRATGLDSVQLSGQAAQSSGSASDDLGDLSPAQKIAVMAIRVLLGHTFKFSRTPQRQANAPETTAAATTPAEPAPIQRHVEMHSEAEETNFQAAGEVTTADGRSIQFSLELNMQREFQSISVSTGSSQTTDPLVINFGGSPAQLTGAKVSFDLNSDGKQEQISFVAGGSGFLVLDSNGDGKVNNGSEMFGPQTGDGFAELASYDADGNGWIDESDPVFSKLQIWTAEGLSSLADNGVGAIATSSLETPFSLKDSANSLQGEIRASGVYLSENGGAGTIQQVDLAVG